jgi:hypothetical protein
VTVFFDPLKHTRNEGRLQKFLNCSPEHPYLEFHLHLICALRKKKMATATRLMMSKNLSYEKRRRVASFWIAARGINTWNSIFM